MFGVHKDDRIGGIKQKINIHLFRVMSNPDVRSKARICFGPNFAKPCHSFDPISGLRVSQC
jgi:hypothetical protein